MKLRNLLHRILKVFEVTETDKAKYRLLRMNKRFVSSGDKS